MYLYSIAPIDYFAAFMPVELYIARAVSIEGATPAGVALIQRHVDRQESHDAVELRARSVR